MKKEERYKVVRQARVWDAPLTKKQAISTAKKRSKEHEGEKFAVVKMEKGEPDAGYE